MAATFPKAGPAGAAGPPETPYIHTQASPSSDFTITHGLNRVLVKATAFDADNVEVQVGVRVLDANHVEITTESGLPFSGRVLVL